MIKSMTGFGYGEAQNETKKITIEIKAVNHRYLDLNIKAPRNFLAFETYIRNYISEHLSRGKIDIYVNLEVNTDNQYDIIYNEQLAKKYYDKIMLISKQYNLDGDISAASLSRYNEVLQLKEVEESSDEIQELLKTALQNACDELITTRTSEGRRLQKDLSLKLDTLSQYVDYIELKSPLIISKYKEKLTSKIHDLTTDNNIDESRIAIEVTMMADKICIDEEIVRLKSHISEVKKAIESSDSVGRKLDFVAQELNREANTILSKSTDVDIANTGIEMKTIIEKIREQIQNIE